MATAILYCTFVLLLYLQGNYAQQGLANNPNVGVNNAIGFQQQPQRTNTNNVNQTPNGGLNTNLPPQSNFQTGNLQQPVSGNFQGSLQTTLSLQPNLQSQGGSGSLGNTQFTKQCLKGQLPPGLVINPSKSQSGSTQTNNGCRQNAQISQQQNSVCPISNVPTSQTQNAPFSSYSLAELAALKGHPSLLSLFASQNNNAQPQQMANFNPPQNQLTDVQKQFLVRALQSQFSGQNQPGVNYAQPQLQMGGGIDNRPTIAIQGSPVSPQQTQATVTPIASQQPYITVQAQPLTSYIQNQQPQLVEDPSVLNLILSELQPSDSQYNMYPPYQIQKRESKSNLKTLIPLIINLLKEKNNCGCQSCGCPNNGCSNNNIAEPLIFGGYSNQMNYSQGTEITPKETKAEETKSKSNTQEKKKAKKKVVVDDSEEMSEENDSEYDDSEEN